MGKKTGNSGDGSIKNHRNFGQFVSEYTTQCSRRLHVEILSLRVAVTRFKFLEASGSVHVPE